MYVQYILVFLTFLNIILGFQLYPFKPASSSSSSLSSPAFASESSFFPQHYSIDYDALDKEDAANDFLIWSSIASSLAKWSQKKKLKNEIKLKKFFNNTVQRRRVRRDEEMVCYRNFGCFRDEGPFDYLDTLPASPELINTTFILYTRASSSLTASSSPSSSSSSSSSASDSSSTLSPLLSSPSSSQSSSSSSSSSTTKKPSKSFRIEGEILDFTNKSTLHKSNFRDKSSIKVIIHGFGSTGKNSWVLQMMEALLYLDDFNVIVVDWANGAALPNYVQAAANTQLVGKQIALLIKWIIFEKGLNAKDFHLIGFSLGAHIAGFTGMEIQNISRITGLDPASPLFEGYNEKVRLDPKDASFVDVIHSNGDGFLRGGLGSFEPMGHVDFYPNGGRNQVGCNNVFVGAISDIFYGKWQSLCHHRRAYRFFIDSMIRTCKFHAFQCDSYNKFLKGDCFNCGSDGTTCGNMGYFADQSSGRGKMYLVTRESEPFCANQYKIELVSSRGQSSTWGKLEMTFSTNERNETFQLTSESDEIGDHVSIQGLVVAHPTVINITHVSIKYTKYRGWIYSGKDYWSVDKIILTNSENETVSYCGLNTILQDNVTLQLTMISGNCSLNIPSTNTGTRLARLLWRFVSGRMKPQLLWRISLDRKKNLELIEDNIKYFWDFT